MTVDCRVPTLDTAIGFPQFACGSMRRGIGRVLVAAAETWAQDRGLRHLTLHTGIANIPVRQFYAALGFHEEGIRLTRPLQDLLCRSSGGW